eukprot:4478138-Pyramimonas_sp.AAC.1
MVRQAWPQVVRCLQNIIPSQFARQVRGPMGALIGHMLEVGWTPTSPTEWTAPGDEGAHWLFSRQWPHRFRGHFRGARRISTIVSRRRLGEGSAALLWR